MGVTGQSLPPKNDFEHARGLRNSAYAVNLTYETYRQHIYIYISREISIEHPSVGLASLAQLHGSACNMTRYFTSNDSIFTSRRRVQIQSTSEISSYYMLTKCNKLFITYLSRSTDR